MGVYNIIYRWLSARALASRTLSVSGVCVYVYGASCVYGFNLHQTTVVTITIHTRAHGSVFFLLI